jgi:pyruvate/2-oxoglutarate/acetoin dehydrogenase E1 component
MNQQPEMTVVGSLNKALHELFKSLDSYFLIGEDILDPYGGAFKISKGLSDQYPDRVITTPISESGILGLANGLALRGERAIAEIMFGDFIMLAGDQIVNHAAKFRAMYQQNEPYHLVIRTPMGGGRGYGPTHSQSLEKHFLGVPYLTVVAASITPDPGVLLRKACELGSPVLFIEPKVLYSRPLLKSDQIFQIESIDSDEAPFPISHVRLNSSKPDVSIWCYGNMVPPCLEAMLSLNEKEDVWCELFVVTQLSPTQFPLLDKIIQKDLAQLCVFVEESSPFGGWSSDLATSIIELQNRNYISPISRIHRITAKEGVLPSSKTLEAWHLPSSEEIYRRILNEL